MVVNITRHFDAFYNIGLKGIDEFDIPRIRFLNIAILFGLAGLWLNIIADLIISRYAPLPFIFSMQIPLLACIYFQIKQRQSEAKFTYLILFCLPLIFGQLISPETGTEFYTFVFVLISFKILKNNFWIASLSIVFIGYYIIVTILMKEGILTRHNDLENTDLVYFFNTTSALLMTALLAYRYSQESLRQINEMRILNSSLQKKNQLAHELMKELNHRVKNNLQIVSSLFNLQSYSTEDTETRNALKNAQHRINSIAILHQKLYQDTMIFDVNVPSYLKSLCEYLAYSITNPHEATIEVHADDTQLQIKETIYIGLIVNELVTNSLKYGKSPDGTIAISVTFSVTDDFYCITVADTGKGFSDNTLSISSGSSGSFGLSLIQTITEQYDGSVILNDTYTSGAEIVVTLQLE